MKEKKFLFQIIQSCTMIQIEDLSKERIKACLLTSKYSVMKTPTIYIISEIILKEKKSNE